MFSTIKNLFRSSAIYGAGLFLQKVIGFLLLPVYTHFLAPDQFGVFSLLNTTGQVIAPLLAVGIPHAVVWSVLFRETDESETFSSIVVFHLVFGLFLTGLLCWQADWISAVIFDSTGHVLLLRLIFITMFLELWEYNLISRFRIREKPARFAAMICSRFLLGAFLSIFFLVFMRMGVKGLVYGQLINATIFGTLSFILLWPGKKLKVSGPILKGLIKYGLPIIPMNICYFVLAVSDRYFLQYFSSAFEVGLYALGYNIGMVINIATASLELAWIPRMFGIAKTDPDARNTIGRLLTYYVLLAGAGAVALALASREIIMLMAPAEYHPASRVVPLVALSYLLGGVTLFTNIGMKIQNRMYLSNPIVIGTALLNLGLNYLMIPTYGMMGAAWATLISYVAQTVAFSWVNQRLWHITYEYVRLSKISLTLLLVFLAASQPVFGNLWGNLAFKLLVWSSLPFMLWAMRFYRPGEIRGLQQLLRRLRPGGQSVID